MVIQVARGAQNNLLACSAAVVLFAQLTRPCTVEKSNFTGAEMVSRRKSQAEIISILQ